MSATTQHEPRPTPGPLEFIWSWLNSLPIAITVMLVLAVLSALGTVIPQEHLAQPPMGMTMEQMYIERFGQLRYQIINALGLNRVYFTPYFFALMLWLSLSALVCNITRLRRTVNLWMRPPVQRGAGYFKADKRSRQSASVPRGAVEQVVGELKHARFRVHHMKEDGVDYVYADRGFIKRWGMVALHLSVLVLLFGGIYGKALGVEGMIRLADGEKQELVLNLAKNKYPLVKPLLEKLAPLTYQLDQGTFRIDYDKMIEVPGELADVPTELQDYYLYFVKDFVSTLTVEHNGKIKSQEVKVNHPLILDKLVLYQSGYQQLGYLSVEMNGKTKEYPVTPGDWFVLTADGPADPGSAMSGVEEAFSLEAVKAGDLYIGGKKTGYLGPLAIAHRGSMATGETLDSVLLSPDEGLVTRIDGLPATVRMSRKVDNYSDFSYKRDPGIPVLYLGWIVMILGITLALYIPFAQVWVRVEGASGQLLVAGTSSSDDAPLPRRLHGILGIQ